MSLHSKMEEELLSIDQLYDAIQKTSEELEELKKGLGSLSIQEKTNKIKYYDDIISSYFEKLKNLEDDVGTDNEDLKALRSQINSLRRENNKLQRQVENETISEMNRLKKSVNTNKKTGDGEEKGNEFLSTLKGAGLIGGSAVLLDKIFGRRKYIENISGYKDMSRREKRKARRKWRKENKVSFWERPFGKFLKWTGTGFGVISGAKALKKYIDGRKEDKDNDDESRNNPSRHGSRTNQPHNENPNNPDNGNESNPSHSGNNGGRTNPENSHDSQEVAENPKVENAVRWALDIARDDRHGYEWGGKGNNGQYDCSGLVTNAFKKAGFDVPISGTATMRKNFTKVGFRWISPYDKNNLKRGDILLKDIGRDGERHTEIYTGNGKFVGARGNKDGRPGDSRGNEIAETRADRLVNYGWNGVLRYEG